MAILVIIIHGLFEGTRGHKYGTGGLRDMISSDELQLERRGWSLPLRSRRKVDGHRLIEDGIQLAYA